MNRILALCLVVLPLSAFALSPIYHAEQHHVGHEACYREFHEDYLRHSWLCEWHEACQSMAEQLVVVLEAPCGVMEYGALDNIPETTFSGIVMDIAESDAESCAEQIEGRYAAWIEDCERHSLCLHLADKLYSAASSGCIKVWEMGTVTEIKDR